MISQPDREQIASRRLIRILGNHSIALMRTLEQKISDAGPYNQRIDPHILTKVRQKLENQGRITRRNHDGAEWYYLTDTTDTKIEQRLEEQHPIHQSLTRQGQNRRTGQTLEIAVFRGLQEQSNYTFLGNFNDLDAHDDSKLYSKEEPPSSVSGKTIPGNSKLDFITIKPLF